MLDTLTQNKGVTKEIAPRKISVERERMELWFHERVDASKKKPSAEVVTLTRVLAEILLDHNPINRPVSRLNSADLANDITSGRFLFNGESIVVSNTGTLLDGQHRCQQVVATGTPIETVIVFGPREAARFTIDTGKSKTVSNFLSMKGKLYTRELGAAASYILQWRARSIIGMGRLDASQRPTKAEILSAAEEFKALEISVQFTSGARKTIKSHAILAFCHYVFWHRVSREAADAFILALIDGDGLRKGNPAHYCRNRLINMGREYDSHSRAELIFKCWNADRLGTQINHLKLSGGKLPKVER